MKKLELNAQSMPYVAKITTKFGILLQDVTTDNRADVAAKLLSQFYQGLMEKIWQHADPEEFATLLPQAAELKERAAPGMTTRTSPVTAPTSPRRR